MNTSKITFDFLFKRLSISQAAKANNMTTAEVVKAILSFLKAHPATSYKVQIKHRLKFWLVKDFLAFPGTPETFAKEYGVDPATFRKYMREAVDDDTIIASDVVADKLFRKMMVGTTIISRSVPRRVIKQIALLYVGKTHHTQDSIASIYGTRRETIAILLRRGIAENIVDDVTAEKIAVKIRSYNKSVDSYDLAFAKRENLK